MKTAEKSLNNASVARRVLLRTDGEPSAVRGAGGAEG